MKKEHKQYLYMFLALVGGGLVGFFWGASGIQCGSQGNSPANSMGASSAGSGSGAGSATAQGVASYGAGSALS